MGVMGRSNAGSTGGINGGSTAGSTGGGSSTNHTTSNPRFSVPNLSYEIVPILDDDDIRMAGGLIGTGGLGSEAGLPGGWHINGHHGRVNVPPPAPPAAQDGFTRTPTDEQMMVCPNCGDELGAGETDEKRSVYFIRGCGHVSCCLPHIPPFQVSPCELPR